MLPDLRAVVVALCLAAPVWAVVLAVRADWRGTRVVMDALVRPEAIEAALRACRDHISDERDLMLDDCTFDGDRSTMLAGDAEAVAELDALLAQIDAALAVPAQQGLTFTPGPWVGNLQERT